MLQKIWKDYFASILRRPARFQVAALCFRRTGLSVEILLITSRETRRWILPKGWPKAGFDAGATAQEEAWEEAGVIAKDAGRTRKIGRYRYTKRLRGGVPAEADVDVYAFEVDRLADDFPEADQRERRWVAPEEAAGMVDEKGLQALLAGCAETLLQEGGE